MTYLISIFGQLLNKLCDKKYIDQKKKKDENEIIQKFIYQNKKDYEDINYFYHVFYQLSQEIQNLLNIKETQQPGEALFYQFIMSIRIDTQHSKMTNNVTKDKPVYIYLNKQHNQQDNQQLTTKKQEQININNNFNQAKEMIDDLLKQCIRNQLLKQDEVNQLKEQLNKKLSQPSQKFQLSEDDDILCHFFKLLNSCSNNIKEKFQILNFEDENKQQIIIQLPFKKNDELYSQENQIYPSINNNNFTQSQTYISNKYDQFKNDKSEQPSSHINKDTIKSCFNVINLKYGKIKGFQSINKSCYVNSGLQVLQQIHYLRKNIFLQNQFGEKLTTLFNNNINNQNQDVIQTLKQLIDLQRNFIDNGGDSYICLLNFLNEIKKNYNQKVNPFKKSFEYILEKKSFCSACKYDFEDLDHSFCQDHEIGIEVKEIEQLFSNFFYQTSNDFCYYCKQQRLIATERRYRDLPEFLFVKTEQNNNKQQSSHSNSDFNFNKQISCGQEIYRIIGVCNYNYQHYTYSAKYDDKWYEINDDIIEQKLPSKQIALYYVLQKF